MHVKDADGRMHTDGTSQQATYLRRQVRNIPSEAKPDEADIVCDMALIAKVRQNLLGDVAQNAVGIRQAKYTYIENRIRQIKCDT